MLYKQASIEDLSKWIVGARNLTFAVGAYRGARGRSYYKVPGNKDTVQIHFQLNINPEGKIE